MVIKYLDSKRLSGLSTDTTTTSYKYTTDVGDNYLNLHESVNQDAVIKIISGHAVDSYIQKIKLSIFQKIRIPKTKKSYFLLQTPDLFLFRDF